MPTSTPTPTPVATNAPPVPTISTPAPSLRYKVGDVISYAGSASDPEDGALPAGNLAWEVRVHHCPGGSYHLHSLTSGIGEGGSFEVPDHGDDSFFEIVLTTTDSAGLSSRASVEVHPQTVPITLASEPNGLQLVYDGTSETAPMTHLSVVNSKHTLYAPDQGSYALATWSDGGAQPHDVTVGVDGVTYTAAFATAPSDTPTLTPTATPPGAIATPSGSSGAPTATRAPTRTPTLSPNVSPTGIATPTRTPVAATAAPTAAAQPT